MWLLFTRAPAPDAPYWPGRRWLAAADAVVWPGLYWLLLGQIDEAGGLVVALLKSLLVLSAAQQLRVALLMNHRYQFKTWRWGRCLARVVAIAALLRHLIVG
jgi:hypothetical protein